MHEAEHEPITVCALIGFVLLTTKAEFKKQNGKTNIN
jgi:hypothetical protein